MTKPIRRWVAGLAVAACAVTLAACDGAGDDPTTPPETTATEPSTDVTSEETTSEAPTPPEVEAPTAPPEMEVDDIDGAAAAVWYFLKLYDYMRATGDTSGWEAMTSPECEWCANVLSETESVYADGGRIESPGLEFDITEAGVRLPEGDTLFYTVLLTVVEPTSILVSADGSTTEAGGQTLDPMGVGVRYMDGRFVVVAVNYEVA